MMTDRDSEILLNLGFEDIGFWKEAGDDIAYEIDRVDAGAFAVRLDDPNALYAFAREGEVMYIGKTARSIRKRFVGYCRPGLTQRTNIRCNRLIKGSLAEGACVRILTFTPITHLRYGDFEINLAAGLEDALIKAIDPPWNGRERGQPISEEAEREKDDTTSSVEVKEPTSYRTAVPAGAVSFRIVLGSTYYDKGLINPGAVASRHLGGDGEPISIEFDDGSAPVISMINRTANSTGGARIVGRNQVIACWFQKHFKPGDIVNAQVLGPHRILLTTPAHT